MVSMRIQRLGEDGRRAKIEQERRFLSKLRDQEERCVSALRPVDLNNFKPVAVKVSGDSFTNLLWTYFRVMISSSPQRASTGRLGRGTQWVFFDEVSGGLLGIASTIGMQLMWTPYAQWIGIDPAKDTTKGGALTSMMAQHMNRCLPIFEFGPLTGGKMMALGMTSTEVVKTFQLHYNLDLVLMVIRTLHGRTSQYNRLHPRGIELNKLLSTEERATYTMWLRANGAALLRGETDDAGAWLTHSFADQVDYWKTRWLPNRMDRTVAGVITPDRNRYLLSHTFREKMAAITAEIEQRVETNDD